MAKNIVSKAGTIQSVKVVKGVTMYGLDSIETVETNGINVVTKVRVIIKDTKTGKNSYQSWIENCANL